MNFSGFVNGLEASRAPGNMLPPETHLQSRQLAPRISYPLSSLEDLLCAKHFTHTICFSYVVDNLTLLSMAKKDGTEEGAINSLTASGS